MAAWPRKRLPPPKATFPRPLPPAPDLWSVRPRAAVPMLLPAHHRGVPDLHVEYRRTRRSSAALDEPDLECGVVRRAPSSCPARKRGSPSRSSKTTTTVSLSRRRRRRTRASASARPRSRPARPVPGAVARPERHPARSARGAGGRYSAGRTPCRRGRGCRSVQTRAVTPPAPGSARRERVLHDRLRVPDGAVDLVRVELAQDVEARPSRLQKFGGPANSA